MLIWNVTEIYSTLETGNPWCANSPKHWFSLQILQNSHKIVSYCLQRHFVSICVQRICLQVVCTYSGLCIKKCCPDCMCKEIDFLCREIYIILCARKCRLNRRVFCANKCISDCVQGKPVQRFEPSSLFKACKTQRKLFQIVCKENLKYEVTSPDTRRDQPNMLPLEVGLLLSHRHQYNRYLQIMIMIIVFDSFVTVTNTIVIFKLWS